MSQNAILNMISFPFLIAGRFFKSRKNKRFISFLSIFAVAGLAIGIMALLITISILNGFQQKITQNVSNFTSNIEIQGFERVPLPDYKEAIQIIASNSNVKSVSPFISHEAMLRVTSSRGNLISNTDGVLLKGIDSSLDNSQLRYDIVSGKYFLSRLGGLNTLLVGARLARRLNITVGDTVFIFGINGLPSPLNTPRVLPFVVTGVYETGLSDYDEIYVYTNLNAAAYLFEMPENSVSGFDVMVKDLNLIGETAKSLENSLGYPFYPQTMYQTYRNLFAWIELQKKPIPIIIALIIIVASFNLVGTLLMIVLEKMSDVGILATLGATKWKITAIFLIQGELIGLLGSTIGTLGALILLELQMHFNVINVPGDVYFMNTVPISINPFDFLLVNGIALILCLLASYIPARTAANLNPVESVRFY
ncbi:MAG: ABC transporter permease [Candidatus Kryptoniota bacterium]